MRICGIFCDFLDVIQRLALIPERARIGSDWQIKHYLNVLEHQMPLIPIRQYCVVLVSEIRRMPRVHDVVGRRRIYERLVHVLFIGRVSMRAPAVQSNEQTNLHT